MSKEIHISILDADHSCLKEELTLLHDLNIKHIHLDIGDTSFIPSITFGINAINNILKEDFIFDLHFMVNDIKPLINKINIKNVDCITIHYEIDHFLHCFDELFGMKEKYNLKLGLAIKPKTNVISETILNKFDKLLIMTVEPGFGGQKFIEYCGEKVTFYRLRYKGLIGVDGGINDTTIQMASAADYFIVGSFFYRHKDKGECLKSLYDKINKA